MHVFLHVEAYTGQHHTIFVGAWCFLSDSNTYPPICSPVQYWNYINIELKIYIQCQRSLPMKEAVCPLLSKVEGKQGFSLLFSGAAFKPFWVPLKPNECKIIVKGSKTT